MAAAATGEAIDRIAIKVRNPVRATVSYTDQSVPTEQPLQLSIGTPDKAVEASFFDEQGEHLVVDRYNDGGASWRVADSTIAGFPRIEDINEVSATSTGHAFTYIRGVAEGETTLTLTAAGFEQTLALRVVRP